MISFIEQFIQFSDTGNSKELYKFNSYFFRSEINSAQSETVRVLLSNHSPLSVMYKKKQSLVYIKQIVNVTVSI